MFGVPGTIQVFDDCGPLSPGVRVIYCCAANCPKPQEKYYLTASLNQGFRAASQALPRGRRHDVGQGHRL